MTRFHGTPNSTARLLAISVFALLIILGAGGYYLYTSSTLDDLVETTEDTLEEATTPETVDTEPAAPTLTTETPEADSTPILINEDIPGVIVGIHGGTATLLNAGLEFPDVDFQATEGLNYQMTASGLDLALLADESLAIEQDVYPELRLILGGSVSEVATQEFTMSVTDLTPEFYAVAADGTGAPLSTDVQQSLLARLETAGVTFPSVSPSSPLRFPVSIRENIVGGFFIEAETGSEVMFMYESTDLLGE